MKISKISVLLPFVFAMCFSLFSAPAHAQATRTWVSGVGDDALVHLQPVPRRASSSAASAISIDRDPRARSACLDRAASAP